MVTGTFSLVPFQISIPQIISQMRLMLAPVHKNHDSFHNPLIGYREGIIT